MKVGSLVVDRKSFGTSLRSVEKHSLMTAPQRNNTKNINTESEKGEYHRWKNRNVTKSRYALRQYFKSISSTSNFNKLLNTNNTNNENLKICSTRRVAGGLVQSEFFALSEFLFVALRPGINNLPNFWPGTGTAHLKFPCRGTARHKLKIN